MFDMNGVEIKAGDIVKIDGAYFKNDNGLYFVESAPGNSWWSGDDCCCKKISKTGKISKSTRNICFWPIMVCVSNYSKKMEARAWNEKNATIEVVKIKNMDEVE